MDCAGAVMGGARRFLGELRAWLVRNSAVSIELGGLGRAISVGHLASREIRALRGRHRRVVALNNVGFVSPLAKCWVLLRNPLHFLMPSEDAARRKLREQGPAESRRMPVLDPGGAPR